MQIFINIKTFFRISIKMGELIKIARVHKTARSQIRTRARNYTGAQHFLVKSFFLFTITVTPNPYPRLITFL